MTNSFYNTIKLRGSELETADTKALNQEETILAWFLEGDRAATPFTVQQIVLPSAPITSVRRAMTNLTYRGKLEKTKLKMMEQLGKPNYVWRVKRGQMELF